MMSKRRAGAKDDEGHAITRSGQHHVAARLIDRQSPSDPVAQVLDPVLGALKDEAAVDLLAASIWLEISVPSGRVLVIFWPSKSI